MTSISNIWAIVRTIKIPIQIPKLRYFSVLTLYFTAFISEFKKKTVLLKLSTLILLRIILQVMCTLGVYFVNEEKCKVLNISQN